VKILAFQFQILLIKWEIDLYMVDGGITIGKGPVGEKADDFLKPQPEGELELEHSMDGHTSIRR
jgi:hypothetical protein